ncbi:succinylarginine dihydrolase (plasmid) [Legionella adelaidensis]|uniref:N-succinylarginine dihydrolase n=1 Tax=Legionella adelaidensis TaxID=45056 RepID=A0A0W0R4M0_9GAMM|nr:N-succinylarginine dihydrolase [Legionella adelaidensis]KTC65966.1 succinylarginine dihydrolase [Legionella adelaidensis]VEH86290.1 succinylarginine dihydrolase [Legionella adelaidensis]
MKVYELNVDGLVGPTHHYAGLSAGNLASTRNALTLANPKAAALQGLSKMRLLHEMGLKQAFLPPHPRPNIELLTQLGFSGTREQKIKKAKKIAPSLLSTCFSSSGMWTANAATVSASLDTLDKKVHFTPANLVSNLHRFQETDFTAALLKTIFSNPKYFTHHSPLPRSLITGDEGAANYNRLCANHATKGISLFVYGRQALPANNSFPAPLRFPARQTLEASQAVSRLHGLCGESTIFACQNPLAIDQGVFHNDVISVANENVFLLHEEAFLAQSTLLKTIEQKSDFAIHFIEAKTIHFSVPEAVQSYLFNSQLITVPDTKDMILISPIECEENSNVLYFINEVIADSGNPIRGVRFLNLRQSMRNGGGPACLRLRVPLTEEELAAMHPGVLITDPLLERLEAWINKHYRTELYADDLDDPELWQECESALDELTSIIGLKNIYPFQRV